MLRKKLESESGTEIADSGNLKIYEKPADPGFGLPSLINIVLLVHACLILYLPPTAIWGTNP